jgi:hypothetical protein
VGQDTIGDSRADGCARTAAEARLGRFPPLSPFAAAGGPVAVPVAIPVPPPVNDFAAIYREEYNIINNDDYYPAQG